MMTLCQVFILTNSLVTSRQSPQTNTTHLPLTTKKYLNLLEIRADPNLKTIQQSACCMTLSGDAYLKKVPTIDVSFVLSIFYLIAFARSPISHSVREAARNWQFISGTLSVDPEI